MKLYRFSPIRNKFGLLKAIKHTHFECHKLCKQSFGKYLPVVGNIGIFCQYDDEYESLTEVRKKLTDESESVNQKYYRLYEPIIIPAKNGIPETTYTHLYIRKPDPYRHHVGDVDFYLEPEEYIAFKNKLLRDKQIKGARVFYRTEEDMIELYNPNIDALGYVYPRKMIDLLKTKSTVLSKH